MVFRPVTLGSLLYAAVFIIGFGTVVLGDHDDHDGDHDEDCHTYTDARSSTATCNEVYKCTGGCTGYVVATQCTPSSGADVKASKTTEKCTFGYGKSSATMAMCINENGSFDCYGPPDGKAECKGCTLDASRHFSNTTSSSSAQPGDGSNAGSSSHPVSNTVPIVEAKAPEKPSHSSASSSSVNLLFLSIGALVSATFL